MINLAMNSETIGARSRSLNYGEPIEANYKSGCFPRNFYDFDLVYQ
jgi:hypothetical protein